jgi:stage III sporulation protein AE
MLLSLALLSSLGNAALVRELSGRLSGLATLFFSVLSVLLLASLAFQSILAASADSVALRTVKYTASSAIPHVGSTLSGALGALGASLSLLRGALGGGAVIALLALLLPPLIELLLLRISLSLSASVCAFTEASVLSEVIARFRRVLDLLLAALLLASLLFLLLLGIFSAFSPTGG